MKKFTILLSMILMYAALGYSQVAINTDGSAPDSSAMLDVKSTSGGLLLPRLSNSQRAAISSPAAGLLIFNTDKNTLQIFTGTVWKDFYLVSCAPEQPGAITGKEYPECNEQGVTYSIDSVSGATNYSWKVPDDATIVSGQGTTSIMVDMGEQDGYIEVRAESECGNSPYQNLYITIDIPAQPGAITGKEYPSCNEQGVIYSIDSVDGATSYSWEVPDDAAIQIGQGTTSITVNFGTSSGVVSVRAKNSCGSSVSSVLSINIDEPPTPGTITGRDYVELNATGEVYSIDSVNGATHYNWLVPSDAEIVSGQGTDSIVVNFGIESGNISVRAENGCGNSDFQQLAVTLVDCGNPIVDSRDGKSYNTVLIGSQCWMAENLNVGTRIDGNIDQTNNDTIEKYCYDNNFTNCNTYGGLYQWDEMMQYVTTEGTQGICPPGWHIPTDAEWMTLEEKVESTAGVNWNKTGWRGTDVGNNLREVGTDHWSSPNTGATNNSGFTSLPAGFRSDNGAFSSIRSAALIWSSNENGGSGWYRYMAYNNAGVSRYSLSKAFGFSVRCVKD